MDETISEAPIPEQTPAETPQPVPEQPQAEPEPETAQAPTQTAQMGRNEPLPQEPEPFQTAPTPIIQQAGVFHTVRDVLTKAREKIQFRKRAKLDKILRALETKNNITNDEVEKLLHVSDATATRYLSVLEKEGKIKQVGKTGAGVVYEKI